MDSENLNSNIRYCDPNDGLTCAWQFQWDLLITSKGFQNLNMTQGNATIAIHSPKWLISTLQPALPPNFSFLAPLPPILTPSPANYATFLRSVSDPVLVKTPLGETVDESACSIAYSLACENPSNLPYFRDSGTYCYSNSVAYYYMYLITGASPIFQFQADVSFRTNTGTKTVSMTCSTDTATCTTSDTSSSTNPWVGTLYHAVESSVTQSGILPTAFRTLVVMGGDGLSNTTDASAYENWFFVDTTSAAVDPTYATSGLQLYLSNCLAPTSDVDGNEQADPFPESARSYWADIFGVAPSSLNVASTISETSWLLTAEAVTATAPAGLLNIAEIQIRIPFQNDTSIQWV